MTENEKVGFYSFVYSAGFLGVHGHISQIILPPKLPGLCNQTNAAKLRLY